MALALTFISASFFAWALSLIQQYRVENPWLFWLMPVLIVPILWDLARPRDVLSTREEVRALSKDLHGKEALRPTTWLAGVKQVLLTLFAHLVGASVGREAVGIQLGGWAGRLRNIRSLNFSACIATGFAIVLGTPFAAAIFVFESKRWKLQYRDVVAIPIIAWFAYRLSLLVGVSHVEYRNFSAVVTELQSIGLFPGAVYLVLLTLITSGLSFLFLHSLDRAARRKSGTLNDIVLPFLFLVVIAVVAGSLGSKFEMTGLPGLGVSVLPNMSIAEPESFNFLNHPLLFGVLKVFLTAGFVGIGVRGGELTPLLVAGSLVAVGLGAIMGLPIAGLVTVGFSLLWGIAARRPVTAGLLSIEMFGFSPYGSLGVLVALLVFIGMKISDLIGIKHSLYD